MRILFLSSRSAFSVGLEGLLRREAGFDVMREVDPERAIECVREMRPGVVVMDSGVDSCHHMPTVMHILNEGLGTRVIVLSLEDNTILVYQGHRRLISEVKDLVDAIEQSGVDKPTGPVCDDGG